MRSTPAQPKAVLVADAIARIEERRVALDLLADRGIEMIERLVAGEDVQIPGRKPFADPARAFAVISRAVRLCMALASRLDQELIALLRGGPIPDLAILAPEPETAPVGVTAPEPAVERQVEARERVARAMDAVIEAEAETPEAAERMRGWVRERLFETENFDALLHKPWRVIVQAICDDLGLHPDWKAWDNGEGFSLTASLPPPNRAHPGEVRDPDRKAVSLQSIHDPRSARDPP